MKFYLVKTINQKLEYEQVELDINDFMQHIVFEGISFFENNIYISEKTLDNIIHNISTNKGLVNPDEWNNAKDIIIAYQNLKLLNESKIEIDHDFSDIEGDVEVKVLKFALPSNSKMVIVKFNNKLSKLLHCYTDEHYVPNPIMD